MQRVILYLHALGLLGLTVSHYLRAHALWMQKATLYRHVLDLLGPMVSHFHPVLAQ